MKRIIKNNMVLIVVLGASLVVTIGLLVWTALEYIQMSNYIAQTARLRSDIATLIKKTPAPVEGNVPLIKTDTTLYAGAAEQLRRKFGHPFLPALEQFISVLRLKDGERITLAKFREDFMAAWSKGDRIAQKYSDYKSFQRGFRNWSEAMQAFRNAMEKATVEPITDNNIDEVFLTALGIPRQFDSRPENLQRFMTEYRRRLLEITRDKVLFETPEAANFSFPATVSAAAAVRDPRSTAPNPADEYPMIAQHWEILSDIVKRASQSGIHSFISFRKRAVQPEKVGGFDVFHYSIELTGTMESIRKFVSLLDQAFQDNRVYVVRSIFLYQDDEGAKKLLTPNEILPVLMPGIPSTGELPGQPRRRRGGAVQPEYRPAGDSAAELAAREAAARKAAKEEEEKSLPYNLRTGYGEILIGKSNLCRAIIDVEYIMESGNGAQ